MFANTDALAVLLAGIAVSVLLSVLVLVLATGRARATHLVAVKTGELRHQALHDSLTGLPNRALITDRADAAARAPPPDRQRGRRALHRPRRVQERQRHAWGTRPATACCAPSPSALTASLRDADTVGRMGGDEFVVLVDADNPERRAGVGRGARARRPAPAVRDRRRPEPADRQRQHRHRGRRSPERRRAAARRRCRAVPGQGRRQELLRALRRGDAERGRSTASSSSSTCARRSQATSSASSTSRSTTLDDLSLVGVEALLRWEHPVLGHDPPDEFIPMLETDRLRSSTVGRWVLQEACAQMAAWHDAGQHARHLGQRLRPPARARALRDDVRERSRRAGSTPSALTLEVTETALMRDTTRTAERLGAIKELGVQVAIDDFGTGYSSLAYLQQLPGRQPEDRPHVHQRDQRARPSPRP